MTTGIPLRLHLGCGAMYLDGYVNIDAFPVPNADRQPDRLLRVEDLDYAENSVDAIYASHVVEHLSRTELLAALPSWYQALRPGGLLTIEVPDAEAIMRRLLAQRRDEDKDLYYFLLFGTQAAEGEFHKDGWTFTRLARALRAAGFVDLVDGRRGPRRIENRLALRMYRPRRWRAVLLECRKPARGGAPDLEALRRSLIFTYDMQDLPVARLRRRLVRLLPLGDRLATWWRMRARRP
jgi:SAM-dependent methyltransferase